MIFQHIVVLDNICWKNLNRVLKLRVSARQRFFGKLVFFGFMEMSGNISLLISKLMFPDISICQTPVREISLETSLKTEKSEKVETLTKKQGFLILFGIVGIEFFTAVLFQRNAEQNTKQFLGHSQAPFFSSLFIRFTKLKFFSR